jgi:hypothetical protein
MTDYDMEMALRAPVAKALKKYVCRVCGWFKSEHGLGCPESGRMTSFKPGGYVDLPDEVWDVILRVEKPKKEPKPTPEDSMAVYGSMTIGDFKKAGWKPKKPVLKGNGKDKQARPGDAGAPKDVQGTERPRKAVRARGHVRAAVQQGRPKGR